MPPSQESQTARKSIRTLGVRKGAKGLGKDCPKRALRRLRSRVMSIGGRYPAEIDA